MPDIEGTVTKPEGTKIELYAYPCASDIHLTVVHAGETIVDKDIAQMEAWVDDDKIEFVNLELKGDLTVRTTVLKPETYTVSYEDQVKDENVAFTVASVDMSEMPPVQKPLASGDKLEKGEMVAARVINDAEYDVILTQYDGDGKEEDRVTIAPGDANGFMLPERETDVRFVLTKAARPTEEPGKDPEAEPGEEQTDVPTTYTVTYEDKIGDDRIRFLVASVELVNGEPQQKLVASGDKLEKGEMIAASVVNDADFTAVLTQYDGNGKETGKVEIAAGEANGFMHMEWSEDVRFVLTRSEEPAKPTEEPTQSPAASPTGTTSPTQSPTASPTESTTATPSATVTVTPAGSAGRTSGTAASQTAASATSSSAGSVRTADESHAPFYLFSSVLAALAAVMLLRARRSIG